MNNILKMNNLCQNIHNSVDLSNVELVYYIHNIIIMLGMSAPGETPGLESLPQAWHVYFKKGRKGFESPY